MKCKKWVAKILSVVTLITAIPFLSGTKVYDEQMISAEAIATKLFCNVDGTKPQTVYSYDLKGLDGEEDFILVTGKNSGYAIFTREDLNLIEYSPYGDSPFEGIEKSQSRYAGPANYFVKSGADVKNIHTKESIKQEKLAEVASNVKSKAKRVVAELPVVKEEVSTMSLSGGDNTVMPLSAGVGGAGHKDIYEYPIVSQKLISDYEYFLGGLDYGPNIKGTCLTVATQILLGYNNWSKYGKLITNPEFLAKTNRGTSPLIPYHNNNKSTSEAFYKYLEKTIEDEIKGAFLYEAVTAIRNYWLEYDTGLTLDMISIDHCNLGYADIDGKIKSEINDDRPLILGCTYYDTDGSAEPHYVVTYGYQTFKISGQSVDGYICHMGWSGENKAFCWINGSWLNGGYLTFAIDHTHSDVLYNNYVPHIVQCETCYRIATNNEHTLTYSPIYLSNESGSEMLQDTKCHDATCNCGLTRKLPHDMVYIANDEQTHRKVCYYCGYVEIESIEHSFYYSTGDECAYCYYNSDMIEWG